MENKDWLILASNELNRRLISQIYSTTRTAKKLLEQTKIQMMNEIVKCAKESEMESLERTIPTQPHFEAHN